MSYNILALRKVYLVEVEIYSSWSISSILGVYVSFLSSSFFTYWCDWSNRVPLVKMFMYLANYGIVYHLKSFVDTFYDIIVDCGIFVNTAT